MIDFEPPQLKDNLIRAVKIWTDLGLEAPEELESFIEDKSVEGEVQKVNLKTEVSIGLDRWDDTEDVSCEEFVEICDEIESAKIIIGFSPKDKKSINDLEFADGCITIKRCLVKVEPFDAGSYRMVSAQGAAEDRFYAIRVGIRGIKIVCSLVQGFTVFGVLMSSVGFYDKYHPPVYSNDLFVNVEYEAKLENDEIECIVNSYLFELSATLGCSLKLSPRSASIYDDWDEDVDDLPTNAPRLRPLMVGKGMRSLFEIYYKATTAGDLEISLLYFVKVVEYVSQTVVRQQANDAIRSKLLSPRALQPDANFIAELEVVVDEQRILKKDREAIKQTIVTCCDAVEISPLSPGFLGDLKRISSGSKAKEQEEALNKFALSLYVTRNSIAHAKANYSPTGDECPEEQMREFVACVRIASQQVIRWYSSRSEADRLE